MILEITRLKWLRYIQEPLDHERAALEMRKLYAECNLNPDIPIHFVGTKEDAIDRIYRIESFESNYGSETKPLPTREEIAEHAMYLDADFIRRTALLDTHVMLKLVKPSRAIEDRVERCRYLNTLFFPYREMCIICERPSLAELHAEANVTLFPYTTII